MDGGLGGVVGLNTRAKNYMMDPSGKLSKIGAYSESEDLPEQGFERFGANDDMESPGLPSPLRNNSYIPEWFKANDLEIMKHPEKSVASISIFHSLTQSA